tara:strand:+ start:2145 stop:2477 length:333 start_codon:yes stop_codon:yes gene_type:complete
MNDGIKQLLDSEDMTNLKLAVTISDNIEEIADYIIKECERRSNKSISDSFSLLDTTMVKRDSESPGLDREFTLYDDMPTPSPAVQISDTWINKNETLLLLIEFLNELLDE